MSDELRSAFTVDTGLFRQLGELLVGRDATALVELVKNAYDADATEVVLNGSDLANPARAVLQIVDDGTGMTPEQFQRGFLRVAARTKTMEGRESVVYQRRYTGEKGVGRLAAHKLASHLRVYSVAPVDPTGRSAALSIRAGRPDLPPQELIEQLAAMPRGLVEATIDWDAIEKFETLEDVDESALRVSARMLVHSGGRGTTITLTKLRRAWNDQELGELSRQLSNFEPPSPLVEPLPHRVLPRPALFDRPTVRDGHRKDPGLQLRLEGDLRRPPDYWSSVERSAEWVLEVRADRGEPVRYAVVPTQEGLSRNRFARPVEATAPHPNPDAGPFFHARVLLRSGTTPTLDDETWAAQSSGVRVYLEGFRVLPYGDVGNDWLRLDLNYTRRSGRFSLDPLLSGPEDNLAALRGLKNRDYSLRLLSNRNFFGAVFLTDRGAASLRTLVNREGFVPDEHYERLTLLVRRGTDLLLRARALASYQDSTAKTAAKRAAEAEARAAWEAENAATRGRAGGDEDDDTSDTREGRQSTDGDEEAEAKADPTDRSTDDPPDPEAWRTGRQGSAARLLARVARLSEALPADVPPEVAAAVSEVRDSADALASDASLLRVLASVGSQLSAFYHETRHLLPTARAVEQYLAPRSGLRLPEGAGAARRAITELRRGLERQASYLTDVVSTASRERRTRQTLRDRVDIAARTLQGAATQDEVTIENIVPTDVRTPPMFPAEVLAVLTNLFTNAMKAAGKGGKVRVSAARQANGTVDLLIQNTGVGVDPKEGEQWFVPFASTSAQVDTTLGQGTGLGLPITRDLLAEYGSVIRFVEPEPGFATAVRVTLVD